jgi:hypothetical protein
LEGTSLSNLGRREVCHDPENLTDESDSRDTYLDDGHDVVDINGPRQQESRRRYERRAVASKSVTQTPAILDTKNEYGNKASRNAKRRGSTKTRGRSVRVRCSHHFPLQNPQRFVRM